MKYSIYAGSGLLLSLLLFSGYHSGSTQQTINTAELQPKAPSGNFVFRKP